MESLMSYHSLGRNRAVGLLLIRVAVGLVFFMHGWSKIHNVSGVEGMMAGFGLPSATGAFIAWLEVIGGTAMMLGIATRLFALLFAIEMVVAIYLTGVSAGYQRHELEIFLALVSLGIMFTGSGRYSLWALEHHMHNGEKCKDGKCEMK